MILLVTLQRLQGHAMQVILLTFRSSPGSLTRFSHPKDIIPFRAEHARHEDLSGGHYPRVRDIPHLASQLRLLVCFHLSAKEVYMMILLTDRRG